ncbi:hypothetical protein OJ936_10825, partial [Streptococcus anginosus]|nr:hypothetical protein [Streptococcus anginosus]
GNHDFQCGLSLEELTDIYREFSGCINPSLRADEEEKPSSLENQQVLNSGEAGTFALPVRDEYNRSNLLGRTIIKSGDYAREGGYAQPSVRAMQFLKHAVRQMNVRAIAFQHMPVQKYYDLLHSVPATTVNAIQGYRAFENHSYVLDEKRT